MCYCICSLYLTIGILFCAFLITFIPKALSSRNSETESTFYSSHKRVTINIFQLYLTSTRAPLKPKFLMYTLLEHQTRDIFCFLLSSYNAFSTNACFSVSHQVWFSVSHCLLLDSAWTEQLSNYVSVTAILPLGPSCYPCMQVTKPGMVTFLACEGWAMWLSTSSTAGCWVTSVNLMAWQCESDKGRWNRTGGTLSPKNLAPDCD